MTDWTQRYENAWVHQSDYTSLDAELSDMLSRHPDWNGRIVDPPARVPAPASPTTVPGRSTDTSIQPSVSRGMGDGNVEQWRPLVAGHFPPGQVDNALCVINSESGGNPSAKNPRSEARGLFQVMASVWAPHFGFSYGELYEPEKNTWTAAQIWADAGWQPWSPRTRRNCGL